ncbi:MAG: hypothetical protein COU09_02965 [Candidatus Harrisonbacteria bacterium CG10_big_fil_rev_8_21_14_0_10_44_23]|uniref:Uncharacterized protein n=1 Tax=Candidatus Harrisonbacteria bacterium CG10_big_fil_rev_8_21_14_0_10_44_23 TaxID=1974585 RepID=A0A2H0UPF1_9BACT|nr:MAG: hypothetical protein COU09_02965 [Candidatus Harrisonbacteria bacterium CG10_big_fil_rev_8_21_14_0_10_44_23]
MGRKSDASIVAEAIPWLLATAFREIGERLSCPLARWSNQLERGFEKGFDSFLNALGWLIMPPVCAASKVDCAFNHPKRMVGPIAWSDWATRALFAR